jgi:hypothetical protein
MLMAASVFFTASAPLLAQRLLAGVPSALVFILAARWPGGSVARWLGGLVVAWWRRYSRIAVGFLLCPHHSDTGLGIVLSTLGVPLLLGWAAEQARGWARPRCCQPLHLPGRVWLSRV